MDARRAELFGLADEVHPAAELDARAHEFAAMLATRSPQTLGAAKAALEAGPGSRTPAPPSPPGSGSPAGPRTSARAWPPSWSAGPAVLTARHHAGTTTSAPPR
ncbi:hypothetical protein [Kitasatospora albolonga]|uniref:hypothetical protein n=1 Tax=Kitasatospora albolonga TaxID=68173 RepID=UPI0031EB7409